MLRFTEIHEAPAGTLASMLKQAYAAMLVDASAAWAMESKRWDEFDRAAFTVPEIGRSTFLSWHDQELVGFGSFDPRGAPRRARIGHNCILPVYRGRGYGSAQLREILRRLEALGVTQVDAFTLEVGFFVPAQRMYATAGFELLARAPWKTDANIFVLHFQKNT